MFLILKKVKYKLKFKVQIVCVILASIFNFRNKSVYRLNNFEIKPFIHSTNSSVFQFSAVFDFLYDQNSVKKNQIHYKY